MDIPRNGVRRKVSTFKTDKRRSAHCCMRCKGLTHNILDGRLLCLNTWRRSPAETLCIKLLQSKEQCADHGLSECSGARSIQVFYLVEGTASQDAFVPRVG